MTLSKSAFSNSFFCLFIVYFLISGCASTPSKPPEPKHIVYNNISTKYFHAEDKIPLRVAIFIPEQER